MCTISQSNHFKALLHRQMLNRSPTTSKDLLSTYSHNKTHGKQWVNPKSSNGNISKLSHIDDMLIVSMNMSFLLKAIVHPTIAITYLLPLKIFQTCMTFFFLLNIKIYCWKNIFFRIPAYQHKKDIDTCLEWYEANDMRGMFGMIWGWANDDRIFVIILIFTHYVMLRKLVSRCSHAR